MKIMHLQEPWPNKINFVDENEAHLGFSGTDDCCAKGGWFLSDNPTDWPEEKFTEESMDLPGWTFDPAYFVERGIEAGSEGDAVQFRIVNGNKEKFLTLYNHHNGYYSRGFELDVKGQRQREGSV